MANMQILPPCNVPLLQEQVIPLTLFTLTAATAGAIGALGARLVTQISPKPVGTLFAVSALITSVSFIAIVYWGKPKDDNAQFFLAAATGGLCGAILCHKTVVPLTVTSAVMFPILTTVATFCGLIFAISITKKN